MLKNRCEWAKNTSDLDKKYHDEEWGVPEHNDKVLFEFLVLEGAQAGLSWSTILRKREGYRKAFLGFDFNQVASFNPKMVETLAEDKSIVRNKLKIKSTITNALKFIEIRDQFGSFDKYIWSFVNGSPIINKWKLMKEVPATTPLSDLIAKDLKKRGFKFVGSTIIYAYMQAIGMVNDHTTDCFRYLDLVS